MVTGPEMIESTQVMQPASDSPPPPGHLFLCWFSGGEYFCPTGSSCSVEQAMEEHQSPFSRPYWLLEN